MKEDGGKSWRWEAAVNFCFLGVAWPSHPRCQCSCARALDKIEPPESGYPSTRQQTALTGFTRLPGKNWNGHEWGWECVKDAWGAVGVDTIKSSNDF